MGSYLPPLPSFLHDVHDPSILRRPVCRSDAMNDQRIDVISAQFSQKTIDVLAHRIGLAAVRLCLDDVAIPRDPLDRFTEIRIRAILISQIKKRDSAVKRVAHQACKSFLAQSSLVGFMIPSDGARADSYYRHLETALAQLDLIGRALYGWIDYESARRRLATTSEFASDQTPCSNDPGCGNGCSDKFAAAELVHIQAPPYHGAPLSE